jgi:outer membrane protein
VVIFNYFKFIIFSFSLSATAEASPIKLNLKSAIQYAVDNSPQLEIARKQMAISDMERKNAYSLFLPQLNLEATHGINDRDPRAVSFVPANRYVSQFGLNLTENLYDNGISLIRYDSAKVAKRIADIEYSNNRDQLVLRIADQFLQLSLVTRLWEVQKTQYDIVSKQFNSISNQYKQGIKTRRDFLRFKSELRRSEIQLQSSETRIQNTRADLIKIIASTEQVKDTDFDFELEPVNMSLVKAVPVEKPVLENHWLFQVARMRTDVFENDVTIARRSYYPEFFLTGGATYGSLNYWKTGDNFKDNDYTAWNALLTVRFNLWDWGIRNRNITIAKDRKVQQEKTIETQLNEFIANNEKLMSNISLSNKNFLTSQELLGLETDSYAFLEGEYRNGRSTYLDLIVGLRDLLNAKIQMFTSYYELRVLLLQYQYHQGQLYENFQ